jgi:hypothetical protein
MTGSNINIGSVTGDGNYLGDHGRVDIHQAPQSPAPTVAQLPALLADLNTRITAHAAALPNAALLADTVAQARQEIEAGPAERRRLMSVRSLLATVVSGAAGVTAVTEAVQQIMKLIGSIEAP